MSDCSSVKPLSQTYLCLNLSDGSIHVFLTVLENFDDGFLHVSRLGKRGDEAPEDRWGLDEVQRWKGSML